ITVTRMWAVPERSGTPPSKAVSSTRCVRCCSRSRACSSTSSANLLVSLRVCTSREKKPLGLSWIVPKIAFLVRKETAGKES
uniref:Uncharacterized protein n=1 Tax=Nothoprocta perdicaria TaxID=30464 RepID=A0A8C7EA31_NOTPE